MQRYRRVIAKAPAATKTPIRLGHEDLFPSHRHNAGYRVQLRDRTHENRRARGEFIQEFHYEVNRQRRGLEQERATAMSELTLVNRKLEGLIEAIKDGLRTPGLQNRLDDLEVRKRSIEAKARRPLRFKRRAGFDKGAHPSFRLRVQARPTHSPQPRGSVAR